MAAVAGSAQTWLGGVIVFAKGHVTPPVAPIQFTSNMVLVGQP